jgi:hypothetical protein
MLVALFLRIATARSFFPNTGIFFRNGSVSIASSPPNRIRGAYFPVSGSLDFPESLYSETSFPSGCQQVVVSSHPNGRVILRPPADVVQLCYWYISGAARVTFHTQRSGVVNVTHARVDGSIRETTRAAAYTFDIQTNLLVRLTFDPRDTNSTVSVTYSPLGPSTPLPEFESVFSVGTSPVLFAIDNREVPVTVLPTSAGRGSKKPRTSWGKLELLESMLLLGLFR